MKQVLILHTLIVILALPVVAQENNIFHDRSYWRSNPVLEDVKEKVAEGNDPIQMTSANFDAPSYAMLEETSFEVLRYLIDLQVDPANKSTHDGRNYLMWAAYGGHIDAVKYLIEIGSDIHLVDEHGYSVIPFVATTGGDSQDMYDLLIENGADIKATNRSGANALLLVVKHLSDDLSILDYLQGKGLSLESIDYEGNGLFNYAAITGNQMLMNKAIAWGLPYKEPNKIGGNAMMFASQGYRGSVNELAVFQYLEDLEVPANVLTKEGKTPLHNLAYRAKDLAVFEFFTSRGVDINQADDEGNTLLLNATRGRNMDIVKEFLKEVNDINHQNMDGYSALTYAIRTRQVELVNELVANGAKSDIIDKEGNNLAGHLFSSFSKSNQSAFAALLSTLQGLGVSFVSPQADGNSLVHIAVDKESPYLLEQALALEADLNRKNDNGLTPLHFAVMKAKSPDMVELLIAKGADRNIKTDFDESLYDLAIENELLKQSGFNLESLRK